MRRPKAGPATPGPALSGGVWPLRKVHLFFSHQPADVRVWNHLWREKRPPGGHDFAELPTSSGSAVEYAHRVQRGKRRVGLGGFDPHLGGGLVGESSELAKELPTAFLRVVD
jgi:hypothetical protein